MICRAKFKCVYSAKEDKVEYDNWFKLEPVYTGSEENEKFYSSTPCGHIELGIMNDNVNFEVGKEYYVDFTEAVQ